MQSNKSLYEQYHECCPFGGGGEFGGSTFLGDKALIAYPAAQRVLDFGCGSGYAVKQMRARGKEWFGIEVSEAAYKKHLNEPFFFLGDLSQFADQSFDMIYSTEVLEHIPEPEVLEVIAHLCRVAGRYVFVTISLRPSSNNNRYHCTLRPRSWWEEQFVAHGLEVDREAVSSFQRKSLKGTRGILRRWGGLGPYPKAFSENPPYTLNGETQFWYFAFRRARERRSWLQHLRLALHRQWLIPFLRWMLRSTG